MTHHERKNHHLPLAAALILSAPLFLNSCGQNPHFRDTEATSTQGSPSVGSPGGNTVREPDPKALSTTENTTPSPIPGPLGRLTSDPEICKLAASLIRRSTPEAAAQESRWEVLTDGTCLVRLTPSSADQPFRERKIPSGYRLEILTTEDGGIIYALRDSTGKASATYYGNSIVVYYQENHTTIINHSSTPQPSATPLASPTPTPSASTAPSPVPVSAPSPVPSVAPSLTPAVTPSPLPSAAPSLTPPVTSSPQPAPSPIASAAPPIVIAPDPSPMPSQAPSPAPSAIPHRTMRVQLSSQFHFDTGKWNLKSIDQPLLKDLTRMIRDLITKQQDRIESLEVGGHTDDEQPAPGTISNLELSRRRADTIRHELLQRLTQRSDFSVSTWESLLVSEGYGESRPLAGPTIDSRTGLSHFTHEDRERNRRVEFTVRYKP